MSPMAAQHPCTYPGCRVLVRGESRCEAHRRRERSHHEDKRPGANERGYGSKWQAARDDYLRRNPSCKKCGAQATVLDHIQPHKGDQKLFWDPANWQGLCRRCHNRKTNKFDGGFGNRIAPAAKNF